MPISIFAPRVTLSFVGCFVYALTLMTVWYPPSLLVHDPILRFQCLGVAYVMSYCVAECVRQPRIWTFIGLCGGALLFALDVARHMDVISQSRIMMRTCNRVFDQGALCQALSWMALNPAIVYLWVGVLLSIAAGRKLWVLRRDRRTVA